MIPIVIVPSTLAATDRDELADNYILFSMYPASGTPTVARIGYNRDETVVHLVHATAFDDTATESLHVKDDSTSYQNTTGKTAYAIITVNASTQTGVERDFKVHSAPTDNSKTAATLLYDTTNFIGSWATINTRVTTPLLAIADNHFIVIENTSGASSRNLSVPASNSLESFAIVIEQAA